jgi:hypothetical protein
MDVRKESLGTWNAKKMEISAKHATLIHGLERIHSKAERKESGFENRVGMRRQLSKAAVVQR